jgi:hypothetical protein
LSNSNIDVLRQKLIITRQEYIMAERVKLTRAEVITFQNSEETLKIIPREAKDGTGGGKVLIFNVKTRVNDKSEKSPFLFRKCSMFTDKDSDVKAAEFLVKKGKIIQVTGFTNRRSRGGENEQKIWYDVLNVDSMTSIVDTNAKPEDTANTAKASTDSVPF